MILTGICYVLDGNEVNSDQIQCWQKQRPKRKIGNDEFRVASGKKVLLGHMDIFSSLLDLSANFPLIIKYLVVSLGPGLRCRNARTAANGKGSTSKKGFSILHQSFIELKHPHTQMQLVNAVLAASIVFHSILTIAIKYIFIAVNAMALMEMCQKYHCTNTCAYLWERLASFRRGNWWFYLIEFHNMEEMYGANICYTW